MSLSDLDGESSGEASSGSFFCVLSKGAPWWQPLKKQTNEKAVEHVLEPMFQRYSLTLAAEQALQHQQQQEESPGSPQGHLPSLGTFAHQTSKYIYGSGGVAVCPGVMPLTAELLHVSPYVQQDEATQRIIVFFGYLSNLADLGGSEEETTEQEGHHRRGGGGAGIARQGSLDHAARLTTRALLKLYEQLGAGQEMLLLSELQGQYAFVIFDANKKVVFAARDTSGEEELYYAVAEDGSLMFTNSLDSLPPETSGHAWQPLPPGHYMAGKDAVLIQYALSREELAARERRESCGVLDDAHLQPCPGMDGEERASPAAALLKRLSRPWA